MSNTGNLGNIGANLKSINVASKFLFSAPLSEASLMVQNITLSKITYVNVDVSFGQVVF